ncbi:MAG: hypothetical protein ACON5A_03460 [Candidatus Comchoanobacterales bacterium]
MLHTLQNKLDNQSSILNISTRIILILLSIACPIYWYYYVIPASNSILADHQKQIDNLAKKDTRNQKQIRNLQNYGLKESDLTDENVVMTKVKKAIDRHNLTTTHHMTQPMNNKLSKTLKSAGITVKRNHTTISGDGICNFIAALKDIAAYNLPIHWNKITLEKKESDDAQPITAEFETHILSRS